MQNKGQIQVTFNWVYILIAGAVILLFFIGIVVKQKAASEEQLTGDIVQIMDSIFTAALVSEKTKNFIDTSGLSDVTLYFDCRDGVGEYGILEGSARAENAIDPIFSPRELQTTKLIVWSLPYQLPYKITDFLFVTSSNTKYFVVGNNAFATEFVLATEDFNVQQVQDASQMDEGANFQVRVVDPTGTALQEGTGTGFSLGDTRVSGVGFTQREGIEYAVFYKQQLGKWKKQGTVPILSVRGERDAAKFGAVFSDDARTYSCNMGKALRRARFVNKIYVDKFGEILSYYQANPSLSNSNTCVNSLSTIRDSVGKLLGEDLYQSVETCQADLAAGSSNFDLCTQIPGIAKKLQGANKRLGINCVTLY